MDGSVGIKIIENGQYIVLPFSKVANQYINVCTEPVELYNKIEEVIENLPRLLQLSKRILLPEERGLGDIALKKQFKLAGVRSYRAYCRKALSVGVSERHHLVTFTPTIRNIRGGFSFLGNETDAPLSDKPALIEALKKAIASCEIETIGPIKGLPKFRQVDHWKKGTVTNTRPIYLLATTYEDSCKLKAKLNQYVKEVATFNGDRRGNVRIKPSEIVTRALNIALERPTPEQQIVLDHVIEEAAKKGVTVTIVKRYP